MAASMSESRSSQHGAGLDDRALISLRDLATDILRLAVGGLDDGESAEPLAALARLHRLNC